MNPVAKGNIISGLAGWRVPEIEKDLVKLNQELNELESSSNSLKIASFIEKNSIKIDFYKETVEGMLKNKMTVDGRCIFAKSLADKACGKIKRLQKRLSDEKKINEASTKKPVEVKEKKYNPTPVHKKGWNILPAFLRKTSNPIEYPLLSTTRQSTSSQSVVED